MIKVDEAYINTIKAVRKKKPRLSTLYGMSKIFREVYDIPPYIPVSQVCFLEHGVNFQFNHFYSRLIESRNELIFLDNSYRVKNFYKQTHKTAFPIGPLFPKYRKLKNIGPQPDRKGTLAFPSHSSSDYDFSSGYLNYARELKKLPPQYQPVTICMYYYDLLNDKHKIFIEQGFDVITNGFVGESSFVDHFYQSLSKFEYITSNHEGSYAYYALEMGLPFFLYGEGLKTAFQKIGTANGINMTHYLQNEFLLRFSQASRFDVTKEIIITEEQKYLIDIIADEHNILDKVEVKELVLKNWKKLLGKKALDQIKKQFGS